MWLEVKMDWEALLSKREDVRIEVLSDRHGEMPPIVPHLIGELCDSYRHLRRRHWREDTLFLLADVYLDEDIASEMDEKSFTELTAMLLVAKQGIKINDARQTLTIGTADLEMAELMKIPLNFPIAHVYRSAVDE